MSKNVAVVSYNLNLDSAKTADAIIFRDTLNRNGYYAKLVHQWSLFESNETFFKSAQDWKQYDGIIICGFYSYWNLRELIRSGRPIICSNAAYVDDIGLGEPRTEQLCEDDFIVVDQIHPIIGEASLPLGSLAIGSPVSFNTISTDNHHVEVLVRSLSYRPVLVAHKTHPLVYFGWYGMSEASANSVLCDLLLQSANWAFSGS